MGLSNGLLPFVRGLLTVLKWIGAVVAVVILIVAGLFAYGRLRGPDAAGRAALAAMQPTRTPPAGRNAFPVLWLARWPVPDDQLQAVTAADLRNLRAMAYVPEPMTATALAARERRIAGYVSIARERWPAPPAPSRADLCTLPSGDCLGFVAAHRAAVEAALAQAALPLHRAQQLTQSDFVWNELPDGPASIWLSEGWAPLQPVWLTALADRFVRGDRGAALTDTCTAISTWRRLRQGSNDGVFATVAAKFAGDDIRLAAAMLAQLPADTPAPAACAQALRPVTAADVDSCAWAQRSYAAFLANIDNIIARGRAEKMGLWWLWIDREQSAAGYAQAQAPFCRPAMDARILADESAADVPPPLSYGMVDWISNAIGTALVGISRRGLRSGYADVVERSQDYAAHLRLGAALLALRAPPVVAGQTPAQRYAALPADLHSPGHASGVSADGRSLYVVDRWHPFRPDARFELPLPVAAAAAH